MINQSINTRLDDMLTDEPTNALAQDVPEQSQLMEQINTPAESVFTGEKEQVAGIRKETLERIIQPVQKSLKRRRAIDNVPEEPAPKVDTSTLPQSEIVKESDAVQAPIVQPTAPQTKPLTKKQKQIQETVESAEQFTPEQLIVRQREEAENIARMREAGERLVPGKLTFNYEVLNSTDDVNALIEANAKMYGIKSENITFEEVIDSAKDLGFDKKFIENLMTGEVRVNQELAVNSYRTNKLIKILQTDLDAKMVRVKEGNVTEQEMISMMKDISFNGVLLQSAKNYKTNLGQGLGTLRAKIDDITDIGDLSGLKTIDDFKRFAEKYLNSSQETKNKLVQGVTTGKTIDKLSMIYIGGLLSRPGTHIKNIASTLSAIPLRWANKSTAATFDVARYGFGKMIGQDVSRSVYFSETVSEIVATKQALLNGFDAARFAYKNGFRRDALEASKFESSKMDVDIFDVTETNPFGGFFKFFNYAAKAPGKALFIADEFMKGINYTYELESYATRQAIKAHDDVLINKGTIEEAAAAYDNMATSIFDNPPDFIHDLAAEDVFLKPLEPGKLKKFKDVTNDASLSSFVIKTQIPFLQTPTNLYSQVFEEIPVLAFATKRARQDIASGDPARVQMAIAKQSTGAGAMYLASSWAADGSITGPGPADKAEFKRLIDQGWKPYSIVLDFSGLTPEQREKYNEDGRLVRGTGNYEGKYFFSYEGLEPIGALLAIGASYSEYAKYEDNPDMLNSFIYGALPGVAEYAMSHPLLEGISRIGKVVSDIKSNLTEQTADKLLNDFIAYAMEIGYKSTPIVGQLSGLQKSVAEAIDPYQRDYKLNGDEHPLLAGVLQGYKKIASNVPGLSSSLPRKINIWNESLTNDTAWSPLRASKGKALEANEILVATRTPYNAPSNRVEKTLNGIPVSIKMLDSEYRELIEIANEELMMSERIISKWQDLAEGIDIQAVKGTPVQLKRVQQDLAREMESIFSKARDILVERSPEIQQKLMDEYDKANEVTVESPDELGL
jgi:hypothetical protein